MPEANPNMKRLVYAAKIDDIDKAERTLVVKISTDTIDRDKEVLLPKGAVLENYLKNPVVLWAHDYKALPIAKALWVKAEKSALIAKPKFADYDFAKLCFDLYEGGYLNAFSVGFIPVAGKGHEPTEDDIKARPDWAGVRWMYEAWELLEFSAVPVPSNPNALRLAMEKGLALPPELKALVPPQNPQTPDPAAGDVAQPPPAAKTQVNRLNVTTAPSGVAVRRMDLIQPAVPVIRRIGLASEVDREVEARLRGRVTLEGSQRK